MHFLTALLLAGTAVAAPTFTLMPRADSDSCMARGATVTEWIVGDFNYRASYTHNTPETQSSLGRLTFTLENKVLDYKAKCSAVSDEAEDFFYGSTDYDCEVPLPGDSATFSFDRASGKLGLFQSWRCLKEGGRYTAKGDSEVELDCKESEWKNPDYKKGDKLYSHRKVTCKNVTFKASITEITAVL